MYFAKFRDIGIKKPKSLNLKSLAAIFFSNFIKI